MDGKEEYLKYYVLQRELLVCLVIHWHHIIMIYLYISYLY